LFAVQGTHTGNFFVQQLLGGGGQINDTQRHSGLIQFFMLMYS